MQYPALGTQRAGDSPAKKRCVTINSKLTSGIARAARRTGIAPFVGATYCAIRVRLAPSSGGYYSVLGEARGKIVTSVPSYDTFESALRELRHRPPIVSKYLTHSTGRAGCAFTRLIRACRSCRRRTQIGVQELVDEACVAHGRYALSTNQPGCPE